MSFILLTVCFVQTRHIQQFICRSSLNTVVSCESNLFVNSLVGKTEGKRALSDVGVDRRMLFKIDHKEVGCGSVNGTELVRAHFMNALLNLQHL
jgi:hypothetical protein